MQDSSIIVSIITPSFNSLLYFKDAFDSIISQSYTNWEWIIVDDNSNDGSFDYIKQLVQGNTKIRLFQTDQNSGAAVARNLGIRKSVGRYIAFLDVDDMWKPNKLEEQVKFMQNNDYAITYSNYELLLTNGKTTLFKPKRGTSNYKSLLKHNDIGCLTVIYDSEKLGKILMPEDCPKREDYATWLDITKKGFIAYKINYNLATYRVGKKSVSSNKLKMIKYHWKVYKQHEQFGYLKSLVYLFIHSFNKLFRKY